MPAAISLAANAAYLVGGKKASSGASGPLQALAAKTLANWLVERGASYSKLSQMEMRAPSLLVVPAYNTISGYLNFAVPIVFIAVFQTHMSAGMGMLFNAWYFQTTPPAALKAALFSPLCMFCMQMPIFFICFFWCMFIEGPVFYLQGINSFQNVLATIVMCSIFRLR